MFKCGQCKTQTAKKEPQKRVVTQIRERLYRDDYNQIIGKGTEIVKEIGVCPPCAAKNAAP